jgi:hypothetical protein
MEWGWKETEIIQAEGKANVRQATSEGRACPLSNSEAITKGFVT